MNRGGKQIREIAVNGRHRLCSTFFEPDGEMKGAILIAPAMGVSQEFYSPLASWLAARGFLVATFDYSGIGASRVGKLRDSKVTISDWAVHDCPAVLQAVSQKAEGKPIFWIGHSLGGQIFGWVPNIELISKLITIASGSGYWLGGPKALKPRAWLLWFFVAPIATQIFGYFPGKRLQLIGDLPKNVIKQWRQWCLNPEYLIGVEDAALREKYHAITTPISSLSFTDDELMSEKNIASMHGFYASASKTIIQISPEGMGVDRIGHFGFFKSPSGRDLWEKYLLPELEKEF